MAGTMATGALFAQVFAMKRHTESPLTERSWQKGSGKVSRR
ncbi:hypothetical protein J2848_002364 [Azospirillum lipoferum]|nr:MULTISPECIES: hypothetical protein [Azospirillum]MCP1610697.1 hypothetical protein [Azospirillum lipoferum]MDW5537859.1 hypothetical protein [Azospirillum sp. NL1]